LCQADGEIHEARRIFSPSERSKHPCGDTWVTDG